MSCSLLVSVWLLQVLLVTLISASLWELFGLLDPVASATTADQSEWHLSRLTCEVSVVW